MEMRLQLGSLRAAFFPLPVYPRVHFHHKQSLRYRKPDGAAVCLDNHVIIAGITRSSLVSRLFRAQSRRLISSKYSES